MVATRRWETKRSQHYKAILRHAVIIAIHRRLVWRSVSMDTEDEASTFWNAMLAVLLLSSRFQTVKFQHPHANPRRQDRRQDSPPTPLKRAECRQPCDRVTCSNLPFIPLTELATSRTRGKACSRVISHERRWCAVGRLTQSEVHHGTCSNLGKLAVKEAIRLSCVSVPSLVARPAARRQSIKQSSSNVGATRAQPRSKVRGQVRGPVHGKHGLT